MILLVEDNEDDIFIMKRAMKKVHQPPPLHAVMDGRQALDYFEGVGKYADRVTYPIPSLVFLDLKLPIMHGFEVLKWIRANSALSHVTVVILSSSPEERDRELAKQLGAKTFLVKPPTTDALTQMIEMFLRSAKG